MPASAIEFRETVRAFSDELVALQQPIRILDAIAWGDEVAADFFAAGCTRQPDVDADYYVTRRPLRFEPDEVRAGFTDLRARISRQLGGAPIEGLLVDRIDEYLRVIDLLDARGTPAFSSIAAELYGGRDDELHPGGPTLADLGTLMDDALTSIDLGVWQPPEDHSYTAEAGVDILLERLAAACGDELRVMIDDGIVADAAAGGDYIKLRADAMFSARDLRVLEVHEGWVHVATSLNGRHQPWCTFLGKGTPSTTSTQEGLAVFTEITTMSSTPDRLRKVTRRVLAIKMAEEGGTFLDVYRWFVDEGLAPADAWASVVRVFSGTRRTAGRSPRSAFGRGSTLRPWRAGRNQRRSGTGCRSAASTPSWPRAWACRSGRWSTTSTASPTGCFLRCATGRCR